MKKLTVAAILLALVVLAAAGLAIAKEVRIRQALTHEMNADDKYGYSREQFVEKGYVGGFRDAATREEREEINRAANHAIITEFNDKVNRGEKAALNIVYWTIEGQPIFRHLYFNGRSYRYVEDRSQDGFGDMMIDRSVCRDMQFPPEAGKGPIGVLMDCKTYTERIIVH